MRVIPTKALQQTETKMALSEVDLIVAAQAGGQDSRQRQEELMARCGPLLFYFARRACKTIGLDPDNDANDIVQNALVALIDPEAARFDPSRGDHWQTCLLHLIQNATRVHSRSIRRGAKVRHDYGHPDNRRRHLPKSPDAIEDPHDDLAEAAEREQTTKVAAAVLVMANPEVLVLIQGVYFRGETPAVVGLAIGVDRTTVTRRLERFFEYVRAHGGLVYCAA
jgi:RNA polymerase sigma factor (sigma-70 family)